MIYVIATHATELSRSIMRLLRPAHMREDNWTDLYCRTVTHPTTGQEALALPEQEQVPIHLQATGQELSAMLYRYVADGALTEEERAGIVAAVHAHAGQKVRIADFVPPSWSQHVLTEQQADAAGWFLAEYNAT